MRYFVLVVLAILSTRGLALDLQRGSIYTVLSTEEIAVEWTPSGSCYTLETLCTHWEWELRRVTDHVVALKGTIQKPMVALELGTPGLYYMAVRECTQAGCSEWKQANHPADAKIYEVNEAWIIYSEIAPPGAIRFE